MKRTTVESNQMRKSVIIACTFIVASLVVRFCFEPTRNAVELPYSEFTAMVKDGTAPARIEHVDLQLGLCNYWGREIAVLTLRDNPQPRFMFIPADFYERVTPELQSLHVKCRAVDSFGPFFQILLVLSATAAVTAYFLLGAWLGKSPKELGVK
jgi:hypothetical protein